MKICFISDTHGKHHEMNMSLFEADVIVSAGDITNVGEKNDTIDFLNWFSKLNYKHKIFIAGNHDFFFERYPDEARELIPDNVIYLEEAGIEIDGIKFWGTPYQPVFFNWAFNRVENELVEHWKKIPDDTDILITHSTPFGILDKNKKGYLTGSVSLYNEVFNRIKPKIHCFGHIHEAYGVVEKENMKFINASNLNLGYMFTNDPVVVEI